VEHYVAPSKAADVDTMILGCTHYEYFRDVLRDILGDKVSIINTPEVTTDDLQTLLASRGELNGGGRPGTVRIYSTDVSEALERVVADLFADEAFPNQVTIQSAQIPPRLADPGLSRY
jgi:glutamate racemase